MKKIYVIEECSYEGCFSVLFFSTRKKAEKILSEMNVINKTYSIEEYDVDIINPISWTVWWEIGKDVHEGNPMMEVDTWKPSTPKVEVHGRFIKAHGKSYIDSLGNARKYLKKMGHLK